MIRNRVGQLLTSIAGLLLHLADRIDPRALDLEQLIEDELNAEQAPAEVSVEWVWAAPGVDPNRVGERAAAVRAAGNLGCGE